MWAPCDTQRCGTQQLVNGHVGPCDTGQLVAMLLRHALPLVALVLVEAHPVRQLIGLGGPT